MSYVFNFVLYFLFKFCVSKSRTSPMCRDVCAHTCTSVALHTVCASPLAPVATPRHNRGVCDLFRSRRRRRATRQLRCGGLSGAHKCTFVHLCCTFITCSCTINIGENNALLCINMCQKYHPTRMSNCAQLVMRSRSSSITTTHYKYNL